MERKQVQNLIRDEKCKTDGTRQACIKIWAYLKDENIVEKIKRLPDNGITGREFLEAVELLMSFASQQPDTETEVYNCECDCVHIYKTLCPGELTVSETGIKMCPYYVTEDK